MRKQALTGWEQVLAFLLVILAITAIVLMVFKVDISEKFRNLPTFGSNEDPNADIRMNDDARVGSSLCPVFVGNVKGDDITTQGEIKFCLDIVKQEGCDGDKYTGLKIDGDEVQIEVDWNPIDKKIGTRNNDLISLDSKVFDKNLPAYQKIREKYGYDDLLLYLKNLDGARISGKDICRDSLIV